MKNVILGVLITLGVIVIIHTWQTSLIEDQTFVWSCHTMGDRLCAPQEPWIQFAPGNLPWMTR